MTKAPVGFFNKDAAAQYDEKNGRLRGISECLHFLIGLVLKDLPVDAKVLSVGAGTGADILSLARIYPHWKFMALDPSEAMLEVCKERLEKEGFGDRCEYFHGFVQDLPPEAKYDAVLGVLVGHFVKLEERLSFYENMTKRLRPGGTLINAEISYDLDSPEFPSMLPHWESVQKLMGATPESLAMLPKALREMLTVLPPSQSETLLQQSGVDLPVRFFQALMICAWFGKKS